MHDLTSLVHLARRQGWCVEPTGGGHLRVRSCDPAMPVVFTGSTPRDWRAVRNMRSQLRRAGLDVQAGGPARRAS